MGKEKSKIYISILLFLLSSLIITNCKTKSVPVLKSNSPQETWRIYLDALEKKDWHQALACLYRPTITDDNKEVKMLKKLLSPDIEKNMLKGMKSLKISGIHYSEDNKVSLFLFGPSNWSKEYIGVELQRKITGKPFFLYVPFFKRKNRIGEEVWYLANTHVVPLSKPADIPVEGYELIFSEAEAISHADELVQESLSESYRTYEEIDR
ncbi:MAG: hypothetical protein AB1410_11005 [Acidobacteriota bacterium]